MRMSASGLESTIAVAIDQILRLAPSSRPPIEPVVSSTNATSTAGFARAGDRPTDSDRAVRARAKADVAMRGIVGSPPVFCPSRPRFPWLHGALRSKKGGLRTNLWPALCRSWHRCWVVVVKSDRVHDHGIISPPRQSRTAVGPPAVGNGARDRTRHCAAAAVAGVLLHQRAAAALGPARRSGGAEREGRNLDRRDQVIGGRPARRPEMAGLPDALRPAVLCLHAGSALRDLPARYRPDHRRRLWRPPALRGARASPAGGHAQIDDGAFRDGRGPTDQPFDRSAGACGVLDFVGWAKRSVPTISPQTLS